MSGAGQTCAAAPKREGLGERATALSLVRTPDSVGPCRFGVWRRPPHGGGHDYQRAVHRHDDRPRTDHDRDNDDYSGSCDNDDYSGSCDNDDYSGSCDNDDYSGSCDNDPRTDHEYHSGRYDKHRGFTSYATSPQRR